MFQQSLLAVFIALSTILLCTYPVQGGSIDYETDMKSVCSFIPNNDSCNLCMNTESENKVGSLDNFTVTNCVNSKVLNQKNVGVAEIVDMLYEMSDYAIGMIESYVEDFKLRLNSEEEIDLTFNDDFVSGLAATLDIAEEPVYLRHGLTREAYQAELHSHENELIIQQAFSELHERHTQILAHHGYHLRTA